MPPQDRPDRVAGKSGSAGDSYRRFSGSGQAFPDDRFKVVSFHCGINTTIPQNFTPSTPRHFLHGRRESLPP